MMLSHNFTTTKSHLLEQRLVLSEVLAQLRQLLYNQLLLGSFQSIMFTESNLCSFPIIQTSLFWTVD